MPFLVGTGQCQFVTICIYLIIHFVINFITKWIFQSDWVARPTVAQITFLTSLFWWVLLPNFPLVRKYCRVAQVVPIRRREFKLGRKNRLMHLGTSYIGRYFPFKLLVLIQKCIKTSCKWFTINLEHYCLTTWTFSYAGQLLNCLIFRLKHKSYENSQNKYWFIQKAKLFADVDVIRFFSHL